MMLHTNSNRDTMEQRHTANNLLRNSCEFGSGTKAKLQPMVFESLHSPSHTRSPSLTKKADVQHSITLPPVTQQNRMNASTSHHLPLVMCPKSVSPLRDDSPAQGTHDPRTQSQVEGQSSRDAGGNVHHIRGPQDGHGFQVARRGLRDSQGLQTVEGSQDDRGHFQGDRRASILDGQSVQEQQVRASRRRELARRHLSNSLQGWAARTVLPVLRRTQSFSWSAQLNAGGRDQARKCVRPKRETGSLGTRKPAHDSLETSRAVLRRTHSLREEMDSSNESPQPLSLSLPQPPLGNVSLAALVHELNATMHYPSSPFRAPPTDFSDNDADDDDTFGDFDLENGLDPDLCPRLTGKDTCSTPTRALTPALRKLNRRRVSSRVRTQQWVNQIEAEERRNERRKKLAESAGCESPPKVSLIFEQEI